MQFPKAESEKVLQRWWDRRTRSPLRRQKKGAQLSGGTVFDLLPQISSAETVNVLVELDAILGIKLKSGGLIKLGGYRSRDEFISHMMPRLEARFNNHYGVSLTQNLSQGAKAAHVG